MSEIVIRVEDLGKRYRIGGPKEAYGTLRDSLVSLAQTPLRAVRRGRANGHREFWALRDVSFEVERGEVLGVIGRNGAGKSTLLKILSRITEPTKGYAEIRGRVGSLLEVGTGFHPELTGRENIYLNGAILGMKKAEIERAFDEIVEFAEIEKFLDTPVKRYSSGMYMRLAFSIAAHLEPEILIVDEVLAVGDAAFQKKCLGKMGDVAKEGRTVLFVSHNMTAVQTLCNTVMLLGGGQRVMWGKADEVIAEYYEKGTQIDRAKWVIDDKSHQRNVYYSCIMTKDAEGTVTDTFHMGADVYIELEFCAMVPLDDPSFGVVLFGRMGEQIVRIITRETYGSMPSASRGGRVLLKIHDLNLLPGTYRLTFGISNRGQQLALLEDAMEITVVPWNVYITGIIPQQGIVYAHCTWAYDYD